MPRLAFPLALVAALSACRSAPPSPAAPPPDAAAHAPELPACAPPDVRVVPAANGAPGATLVLLHGYGATAGDILPVARALARGVPALAVLVPDGCDRWEAGPSGRQWFSLRDVRDEERAPRVAEAGARVSRFVEAELPRRGLPTERVAYAGFSQGAMIAEWLAVHGAPRPIAVVAFSGRYDDASPVARTGGAPVLIVHGEQDPRIAFAEADRAAAALVARGVRVERLTRPQMGHAMDEASIDGATAFFARELAAK